MKYKSERAEGNREEERKGENPRIIEQILARGTHLGCDVRIVERFEGDDCDVGDLERTPLQPIDLHVERVELVREKIYRGHALAAETRRAAQRTRSSARAAWSVHRSVGGCKG